MKMKNKITRAGFQILQVCICSYYYLLLTVVDLLLRILRITAAGYRLRLSAIGIQARPFAFARLSREQTLTQVCFAIALRIECGGGGGGGAIVATSLALVHQHAPQRLFAQGSFLICGGSTLFYARFQRRFPTRCF